MNRTQIYLPKRQIEALRHAAHRQRSTMSEILRTLVRERFERKTKTPSRYGTEGFSTFAKRIARRGARGPKDLASRVDWYLYGNQ